MNGQLQQVYNRLLDAFGPQGWWPGDSALEIIIGAVLTQNTSWKNVERAIDNLRKANAIRLSKLRTMNVERLGELIRPAGYFRLKARRLKNLVEMIQSEFDGSLDVMLDREVAELRERLLEVNGIGPETADSIILYSAGLPTFVIDAYTARVLKRHGWVEPKADYQVMKDYFEDHLPHDAKMFNEYHALIVRLGKEFCRKQPNCDECPLADLLPDGKPLAEAQYR